jgi:integrase
VQWAQGVCGALAGQGIAIDGKSLRGSRSAARGLGALQHLVSAYILRLTPEAGTVNGRRFRDVPLHPHLVELGFPAFVETSAEGYLFIAPTKKGGWRGTWQAVKNRVGEFVREVVSDPQVQPNHGWRHRFITLCREHGVDQEIRRMITGHKGEGVDEVVYGDPAGLYREVCKLPRYRIG